MNVLIIEDDPTTVETLAVLLNLKNTRAIITSVTEGKKGVELARENLPDIIILNLELPDIDGFEVLRQIRNFSDVPIIILTAWYGAKYKVKALELGADELITKPFYPYDFLTLVEAILCGSYIPKELKAYDELPLTELLLVKS